MIVVGHEHDGLRGQQRIAAGQEAQDVGRLLLADIASERHGKMDAQRHGLEVAALSGSAELVKIVTRE